MYKKSLKEVQKDFECFVESVNGQWPRYYEDLALFHTCPENGNIERSVHIIYVKPFAEYSVGITLLTEPVKPGDIKTLDKIDQINKANKFGDASLFINNENEIIACYGFSARNTADFRKDFFAFEKFCSDCEEVLYEEIY